jgi:drug/metabolite transporter (DMT)-like permease
VPDAAVRTELPASRWTDYLYLLLVYLVWGSTYLAIRIAVREGTGFPPFTMTAMRTFAGGGLLLLWTAALGQRVRLTRREMLTLAVSGGLLWTGGNGLVVWAEQWAASGYAALVVASAPIWTALLESLWERKLPTALLVGALVVGLAGVGLLSVPADAAGAHLEVASLVALLLAALTWSIGSVLQRRHAVGVSPLVSAAYQMLFGSAGLLLAALLTGEPRPAPTTEAWLAWAYLVAVGSLVGFTSYVQALRRLPLPITMTYAYVNPVIAVALGWLVLGESITLWTLSGMALVLLGVAGVFRDRYQQNRR